MQVLNYDDIGLGGLGDAQKQDYLYAELLKDVFTLKDFSKEITQRKLNAWHNEDLLLEKSDSGKWRKFNFVEYSWIQVVNELRKFEIGYTIIRKLKDNLMMPINMDHIFEEEGIKGLLELIPEENREAARKLLLEKRNNEYVKEKLKWRTNSSIFFMLVFNTIAKKRQTSVCFNIEGFFMPITEEGLANASHLEGYGEFFNYHYFSFSVTSIISKFLKENYFEGSQSKVKLLTSEEEEILKVVRSGNCKSISISFRNDKIQRIDVTTTGKVDSAKRLVDLIMTDGYQDINLTVEKGKIVHFENTRKIKL